MTRRARSPATAADVISAPRENRDQRQLSYILIDENQTEVLAKLNT